jgi:hypothetical protein
MVFTMSQQERNGNTTHTQPYKQRTLIMNAPKEIFSNLPTFQNSVCDDISEVKKRIGLVQDTLGETTILKQLQNDRKRARALLAFCTQTVTQLVELTNAIDDVIEKIQSVSQTAVAPTANTTMKKSTSTGRLNTPNSSTNGAIATGTTITTATATTTTATATTTTQQIARTNRPITVTTTNILPPTQNMKQSSQSKQPSPQESQNRVLTQNQLQASNKSASSSSSSTRIGSTSSEKRNSMQEQKNKSDSDVLDLFFDNKSNDTSAVIAKSKSISNYASENPPNLDIQTSIQSTKGESLEDDLFSTKENNYQKEEASKNLDALFVDDMFSDLMISAYQTSSRPQLTKDIVKKQSSSSSLGVFDEYLGNETKSQQQQKSVELMMDFSDSGNKIVATNNILSLFDKSNNSFDTQSSTVGNTYRTSTTSSSPTDCFDF